MSAVTSKFYKNQPGDKPSTKAAGGDALSSQTESGSIASGKTNASYSTTSSNVSQHSEDRDDLEEEGEWGEMEVKRFIYLETIKVTLANINFPSLSECLHCVIIARKSGQHLRPWCYRVRLQGH